MPRNPDPRTKAIELLGRWTRLAQGHLPLGGGCSCGVPAPSIRVIDLERDVLDYLALRHTSARRIGSIAELLRAIASSERVDGPAVLTDLEQSLESFENLHRG
jgi:hypothetical protein